MVTNAHAKAADWSPHSQHMAQKVCISNSPGSKKTVLMPGREEPDFCSLSSERSLVISLAAKCSLDPDFGVHEAEGQKKDPAVQPA